jgi:hypothetical protein
MIQIDEMVLRVPGLSEADAAGLGGAVAEKLAARIPEGVSAGAIGDIKLSLRSAYRTRDELAAAIAEQILTKIAIATI